MRLRSPYVTVCLSTYGFGRSLHYPGRTMVERHDIDPLGARLAVDGMRTPIHTVNFDTAHGLVRYPWPSA